MATDTAAPGDPATQIRPSAPYVDVPALTALLDGPHAEVRAQVRRSLVEHAGVLEDQETMTQAA